jgi:diguanylate cyclase (GGDEF)-like protein
MKLKIKDEMNERLRLSALAEFEPEAGPEEPFNRIARLVRETLNFPSALISLVDDTKRIYKSSVPDGSLAGDRAQNFCGLVVDQGELLIVEDTHAHDEFRTFPMVIGAPHLRAYWGAPLTTHAGFNVGALAVADIIPRPATQRDVKVLNDFARVTIELMELRAQATIDVLTGLQTRRAFETNAGRLFSGARKSNQPLSCIVLDVDHFKSINDKYGHAVGDKVLNHVGEILRANGRPTDNIGRIGGEEFAIFAPSTTEAEAFALADRLREALATDAGTDIPYTASFGVAEFVMDDQSFTQLIARADRMMYLAKRGGRNRTHCASMEAPGPCVS